MARAMRFAFGALALLLSAMAVAILAFGGSDTTLGLISCSLLAVLAVVAASIAVRGRAPKPFVLFMDFLGGGLS